MKNTLKPCPFCGEAPITAINYSRCGGGELELIYSVICPSCKISKNVRKESEGKTFDEYIATMDSVIELWNKRI